MKHASGKRRRAQVQSACCPFGQEKVRLFSRYLRQSSWIPRKAEGGPWVESGVEMRVEGELFGAKVGAGRHDAEDNHRPLPLHSHTGSSQCHTLKSVSAFQHASTVQSQCVHAMSLDVCLESPKPHTRKEGVDVRRDVQNGSGFRV
eukprot:2855051-Rhodomonas_salina.3